MADPIQYADASYFGGQHGFMAFGLEPGGMIAPDTKTLPAAPNTLLFAGYTGVPGISMPEGTQPIRAAASVRPLQFVPGFRQPTYDNNVILGSGENVELLLACALRNTSTDLVPSASRFRCLPVLTVSGGAFDPCDVAGSYHWQARCAMVNSLSISMQVEQAVSANFQIWPVCVDKTAPITPIQGVSDAVLRAAGGDVFAWQHLGFEFDGTDYTDIIQSASLQISNNLRRGTMRGLNAVSGANIAAKKANPLYRCARQIIPGSEDIQMSLNLLDKLPDTMDGESGLGLFRGVLSNDVATIEIAIETNFLAGQNQQQTGAEAPFGFSASILSSAISISRAEVA